MTMRTLFTQYPGILALTLIVAGIVVYRVLWFLSREKRRHSS
jgi:hypothetical protein